MYNEIMTPSESKKVYYKHFFYVTMLAMAFIFVVALFLTGGEAMGSLLFKTKDQSFMDFFNSMLYNINDPYENEVFYPPLSTIMYKALLLLVPQATIDKVIFADQSTSFGGAVKLHQEFFIPFIIYFIVTFVALFYALKNAKGGSSAEKLLFTFVMITSAPMIFLFERGNNIIIVLIFVLIFAGTYRSESRALRELSLVALAIAITTKMYPIVFCAMLFKDKRYKDIIKTGVYSVILFFLPFFIFYDGTESIGLMLGNLSGFSGNSELNTGVQLNFARMIILPLAQFDGFSNETLEAVGSAFKWLMMLLAVPAALFTKKDWKCAALCCCVLYGFQGTCATYLLTLFCLPVMLLLDTEKKNSAKNYIALGLMILTLGLILSINPMNGEFTRYVSTKISSYAVMFLTVMLGIDGWKDLADTFKELRHRDRSQYKKALKSNFEKYFAVFLIVSVSFVVCAAVSVVFSEFYIAGFAAGFIIGGIGAYFWNYRRFFSADGENKSKSVLKTFAAYGITFVVSCLTLVIMTELMNVPAVISAAVNLIVTVPLAVAADGFLVDESRLRGFKDSFAVARKTVAAFFSKSNEIEENGISTKDEIIGKDNDEA